LNEIGLHRYADQFVSNHITGDILLDLDYMLLKDVGVKTIGDRKRILVAIERLASLSKPLTPSLETSNINVSPFGLSASNSASMLSAGSLSGTSSTGLGSSRKGEDVQASPSVLKQLQINRDLDPMSLDGQLGSAEDAGYYTSSPSRYNKTPVSASASRQQGFFGGSGSSGPPSSKASSATSKMDNFLIAPRSSSMKSATLEKGFKLSDAAAELAIMDDSTLRRPSANDQQRNLVRVDGINDETYYIEVGDLFDGAKIRQKILRKFGLDSPRDQSLYALFSAGGM
jgi:hypothetical protein